MRDRITDFGYAAGWQFVQYLPERSARRIFAGFAANAWQRDGHSVRRLRSNLDRATRFSLSSKGLDDLTRETLDNYARYWCDVFRMPRWSSQLVQQRTKAFRAQTLYDALDSKRPIIAALPHMGNWDLCGLWFTQQFRPITSVAERLKPDSLFDRFVEFRRTLGIEIFAHHSTPELYPKLVQAANAGRLVALVADRDMTNVGVPVEFFGAPTKMPAGPAALTIDTDAVLLPVGLWYEGEMVFGQPFDPIEVPVEGERSEKIKSMTQQLARVFEATISEHPSNWYMLQRVWSDPPVARGGPRMNSASPGLSLP